MAVKKNTIIIDLDKWCTVTSYAQENNIHLNTLVQRIKRHREGKTSGNCPTYKDIKELGITLVQR